MRKLTLLLVAVLTAGMLFADGDKVLSSKLKNYSPDPSSGDVNSALNLFIGPGNVNGFGFSFGGDFEIPMFVDNLTIGPGVNMGFGRTSYYYGHTSATEIIVNAVGYYYFDWLIPNMPDEFDVFANVNLGVGFRTVKYHYDGYYKGWYEEDDDSKAFPNLETYVGGRWNFSSNMSLYAKVGYGSYYGAFGFSLKF